METINASANLAEALAEAPAEARSATTKAARPKPNANTAQETGTAEVYGAVLRWTDDDEADLRALLARRKAAGYRKPSRDVGGQIIKLGRISPNPNTVAASIVALVGLKGEVTRRDLIADMADCTFPHPKAQPKDAQWCTGYISGCLRNAFLEIVPPAEGNQ